jgi:hypothetical protein
MNKIILRIDNNLWETGHNSSKRQHSQRYKGTAQIYRLTLAM